MFHSSLCVPKLKALSLSIHIFLNHVYNSVVSALIITGLAQTENWFTYFYKYAEVNTETRNEERNVNEKKCIYIGMYNLK